MFSLNDENHEINFSQLFKSLSWNRELENKNYLRLSLVAEAVVELYSYFYRQQQTHSLQSASDHQFSS